MNVMFPSQNTLNQHRATVETMVSAWRDSDPLGRQVAEQAELLLKAIDEYADLRFGHDEPASALGGEGGGAIGKE